MKIDLPVLIIQLVTFLIAAPLVWKLFIGSLIKTLKKRDDFITDSLDKIEKDKSDIENMKAEYVAKLAEMHAKAHKAFSDSVAEGEKSKARIVDEAKAEGRKMVEDAKREIEAEKRRAIEEVKDTIVDLSILAAQKAVKAKIGKKEQFDVVADVFRQIEKN